MKASDDEGREFMKLWHEMGDEEREAALKAFQAADPLSPGKIKSVTFFREEEEEG